MDFRVLRYTISFKPQLATQFSTFFEFKWSICSIFIFFWIFFFLSFQTLINLNIFFFPPYFSHIYLFLQVSKIISKRTIQSDQMEVTRVHGEHSRSTEIIFRGSMERRKKIASNCSRKSWRARNNKKLSNLPFFSSSMNRSRLNIFLSLQLARLSSNSLTVCGFYSKSLSEKHCSIVTVFYFTSWRNVSVSFGTMQAKHVWFQLTN